MYSRHHPDQPKARKASWKRRAAGRTHRCSMNVGRDGKGLTAGQQLPDEALSCAMRCL